MFSGKQVFIGSSSEQIRLAKKIEAELNKTVLSVLPWWDEKAFRPGDYTWDRLIQLARICESSVFVFAGDDETWFRPSIHPNPVLTARDNVMLEYGLFVGYGGVERSLIVAENGIKLPSDLKGLNVLFYDKNKETQIATAKKVRRHFEHLISQASSNAGLQDSNFVIRTDWDLNIHRLDNQPKKNWTSTRLYEGRAGAMAWNEVEVDPTYMKRTQSSISGARIAELIGDRIIHSVVSFGPGMGNIDSELIGSLTSQTIREYIPIDINTHFLIQSAKKVAGENPSIECKNAIQCDFDTNIALVENLIENFCPGPRLFLMHGGTFGNLTRSEKALLNVFYKIMDKGDIFTFDLYCKGPNYDPANDALADPTQWPDPIRKFFLNGVRRLTGKLAMDETEAETRLEPTTSTSISALKNTHTVQIKDRITKKTLMQINRFDYDSILEAINATGFSIIDSTKVTVGALERHVLLAQK